MRSLGNIAAALALILLTSCTADRPTDPSVTGISAAKGGGSPKVKVDSTDPSSAEQETTLDVRVFGSGFVEGSEARFLLDGVVVPGVQRNGNTEFVSPSEVKVNITIAVDAIVDLYDVEVRTPRGKKGVGADLFQVAQKGSGRQESDFEPLNVTFRDNASDGVKSDGAGDYVHGVDKVSAHLRKDPRWDWVFRLFTANSLSGNERPIRELCFDFGSAIDELTSFPAGVGCDSANVFTGVPLDDLGEPVTGGMLGISVGTEITMRASVVFEVDGFNWTLRYGRNCDKNDLPFNDGSRLAVTRVADDVWTIEGGIGGSHAILCQTPLKKTKGKFVTTTAGLFTMPFLLTAVLQ